ncbi:MAG: ABC-type transport auxiliary lipoprotein family protein [Pseudomonadota bacterium]
MRKSLILCGILTTCLTAACTLAPRDTGRAFMFALAPLEDTRHLSGADSLIVALPVAAPELDTYRIALVRDGKRWDYYAGARWSEFLPVLVQDNLTKTLEKSGVFKTVTTDGTGISGNRILKTEIRAFHAGYGQGVSAPVVKIRMIASLLSHPERVPLVSFEGSAEEKASGDSLPEIQAAFGAAFSRVQRKFVAGVGK